MARSGSARSEWCHRLGLNALRPCDLSKLARLIGRVWACAIKRLDNYAMPMLMSAINVCTARKAGAKGSEHSTIG